MKQEDDKTEKYATEYRIGKLKVLSHKLNSFKGIYPLTLYYDLLVRGICYIAVLQEKKQYTEVTKVLNDLLDTIDKSPVKLEELNEKTFYLLEEGEGKKNDSFLHDNIDFGPMEHGVVE